MNVLHVIPSVSDVHGGPTRALIMMERSLSAIGISVTTLTTDDNGRGRRFGNTSRPRSGDGATRHYTRKWTEFYKAAPGLLAWLFRNGGEFDVIHIHALFSFSSVAAALVARIKGIPYVIRPLGTLNTYGIQERRPLLKAASFRLIESHILAHAAAVQFTSQGEWNEAKALGIPFQGVVIPLGVDSADAAPAGKPPFAVKAGQKVVLFVSRLDPKKNVEGLIRAFALVRQWNRNAVLVIGGDGPAAYVKTLKELAEAEGIADATIWTGHLDGPQKKGTFAAADVFVLPSLSENFGIAAVEAMIEGRPCVIGRGVAIGDTIAAAGAGLVTDPDPQSIAYALIKLLTEGDLSRKMGARGRELAQREYSPMLMAERLVELYTRIQTSGRAQGKASGNVAAPRVSRRERLNETEQ